MMIKLDMSKAYDKFERGVLKWMLSKLNFYPTFALLLWIVLCQVLMNGFSTRSFMSERGLRQGDPLLSFLFIIYIEGLLTLIQKANSIGEMKGL